MERTVLPLLAGWLAGGIEAWDRAGLPLRETRSVGPEEACRLLTNGAAALDVREDPSSAGEPPRSVTCRPPKQLLVSDSNRNSNRGEQS
jgi:rhodanese-related sulfurtransferase